MNFEWIFCFRRTARNTSCLLKFLRSGQISLNCSTTLVLNRANYGYARSNNIGAAVARADTPSCLS